MESNVQKVVQLAERVPLHWSSGLGWILLAGLVGFIVGSLMCARCAMWFA